MPISFGSVGDIIAICLLVKDLVAALDESKGSGIEYREVLTELRALERALLEVEVLSRSHAPTIKLNALYATARKAALDCRQPVEAFLDRIKKYDPSLGSGASKNIVRNTAMKIRWQLSQKDEVLRIRAEISAHSSSINMLLATVNVNLAQTNHKEMSDRLDDSSNRQTVLIQEVRDRLEENNILISASNAITTKFRDAMRFEWFTKFGTEMKDMMLRILNINIATYNTVVSIQGIVAGGLQRSLNHEPFILEDAIGRMSPVHMQFINSWEALDAVLELRFRKIQGHAKVKRLEYTFQEHSTKRLISRSRQWEGAFIPGQRIDMSLIFDYKTQSVVRTTCPSCKVASEDSQDTEMECTNCGISYRRVIEVHDEPEPAESPPASSAPLGNFRSTTQFGKPSFNHISYGPKPPSQFQALSSSPKRKLDCTHLEEDDLSQFKRVRLVSKEKRKKNGPFVWHQTGGVSFDATQQQKRDEKAAWDQFHVLQASLGGTHPDTLKYLQSFTQSLRNWGKYQTAEMIIRDALKSGEVELLVYRPEILQTMLSGLMVVLVDQQKLMEAEGLWNTSVETFRTKLGEHSANALEKQFQQAHPFRRSSPVTSEHTIFGATSNVSTEPLSMTSMNIGKGFQNYLDLTRPKPEHGDQDCSDDSDISAHSVEVQSQAIDDEMELERDSPLEPFPPPDEVGDRPAVSVLSVKVHFQNIDSQIELQWNPPLESLPSPEEIDGGSVEKGTKGKYSLADFKILCALGTSQYARICLTKLKHNSRLYALKVWNKRQIVKMEQATNVFEEVQILSKIKHPFLLCLQGTFQDSKNLYMFSDFIEGGDLLSLILESHYFPDSVAKFYAAEIILATEYLHGKNIFHSNINPENILLDRYGHLKLCNFSSAKEIKNTTWRFCETPDHLAPEVAVPSKPYGFSVDWWSVGILTFEMLCGFTLLRESHSHTYKNILIGEGEYPAFIYPHARDLIEQLTISDLTKRLGNSSAGAEEIKSHAWFAEVTWERLSKKDISSPFVPQVMTGVGDASHYDKYSEETHKFGDVGHDEYEELFVGF